MSGHQSGSLLDFGTSGIFNIRVFHPSTPSYRKKELSAVYRLHGNAKKREYGARIHEVERGAFTPVVLSTTGGMNGTEMHRVLQASG